MKIEKGKLYYCHQLESVVKAPEDYDDKGGLYTDKIAIYCRTKNDWKYVVSKGYKLTNRWYGQYNYGIYSKTYMCLSCDYHIITINQFKEFYPMSDKEVLEEIKNKLLFSDDINEERKSLAESDISVISDRTDEIVQNVVQKYQQRSNVGIEKYGTTLQENTDGIEVFLNHLQEELMDATLYIEKLKNKFAQLKKDL